MFIIHCLVALGAFSVVIALMDESESELFFRVSSWISLVCSGLGMVLSTTVGWNPAEFWLTYFVGLLIISVLTLLSMSELLWRWVDRKSHPWL